MNRRANLVLAVVVAGVVALAVIAGVSSGEKRQEFAPGTPEAVVQQYATAILLEERSEALTYLDPALECTEQDIQNSYSPGRAAMVLRSAHTEEQRAQVTLNVTGYDDGLFDDFSQEIDFDLHRMDDEWMITGEPWPMYHCGEGA